MSVKLLTGHHLEFLSLKKEAAQVHLSKHWSKCHIVGNHMSWLNYYIEGKQGNVSFDFRCCMAAMCGLWFQFPYDS